MSKSNPHSDEAKRLSAIFQNSQDGIITIDERGLVESINPAAATLFGYAPTEVIGKNINMLMPKPYHAEHDGYIKNYHHTGNRKIIGIGREVEGKQKDGTIFPFFLSVSEVVLEDRKIFTGFIHDISEIKRKEKEIQSLNQNLEITIEERTQELSATVNKLLKTNKLLEHEVSERKKAEIALIESEKEVRRALDNEKELNDLKSRFVSMASHEFRTPLSTILSSVYLIGQYTEKGNPEKVIKHVNRIESAANNLTAILNDFLSLSKLEEGIIGNHPETFILNTLCEEVIDEVEGMKKNGQEIIYNINISTKEIWLDRKLLKNVFLNLLSNALKYTPEHKNIYFDCSIQNHEIELTIKDEGIGIPKQDQERLFSRFFRATNATNIQGTGLGLNIVKKYLDLMGGVIEFESEENKGTTFKVVLPLIEN